jgi:hypothetical protein
VPVFNSPLPTGARPSRAAGSASHGRNPALLERLPRYPAASSHEVVGLWQPAALLELLAVQSVQLHQQGINSTTALGRCVRSSRGSRRAPRDTSPRPVLWAYVLVAASTTYGAARVPPMHPAASEAPPAVARLMACMAVGTAVWTEHTAARLNVLRIDPRLLRRSLGVT